MAQTFSNRVYPVKCVSSELLRACLSYQLILVSLFREALSKWINEEEGFEIFIDVANDKDNLQHDDDD